jgi:hypothetical protein
MGLTKLVEAAQNFARFMTIFKGTVYADVFEEFSVELRAQERRLEEFHVDYVWAMLEDVIRNYSHEVKNTRGKVARNYGVGQPIAWHTDCAKFFKFLLHEKLEALRRHEWSAAPHTAFRSNLLALVQNLPEYGSWVVRRKSLVTPALSEGQPQPRSDKPKDTVVTSVETKGRAVNHQHEICVWHLAGSLGLVSKTSITPYQCFDPSNPVHKPLSDVKHSDALQLLDDKEFMKSCASVEIQ